MKAFFVLRHHNDFDSMTPVIDGWVRLGETYRAQVYVSAPALKWRGDYRTAMLEETGRVAFTDLWAVAGRDDGGYLARRWQRNTADRRIDRKLLQLVTEMLVAPGFAARMTKLLDDFSPDIVAFDWHHIPKTRRFLDFFGYQEAVAWVRSRKRPLVSLPHGLLLFALEGKVMKMAADYDAVFVESERRKSLFGKTGAEKIIVAGSPRYDPQWVSRVANLLDKDRETSPRVDGKINIVFFGTKAAKYFNFSALIAWLAHLASHPEVHLVIQPHPRGQKVSAFAAVADLPNVRIDPRSPASRLIGDADIVSTLVSSVMVEAVVREREILYPKFLNSAPTQFDEVGACVALAGMEATFPAIDAYRDGIRVPRERYDEFLQSFVFGGGDQHTIARICSAMQNMALTARRK